MSGELPIPSLDPDGATGRRWAREELQDRRYSDDQTFLDRLDATLRELWSRLVDAFDPQENPWGTVVLVVLVVAIVAFIVWRVGRPRRGTLDLPARAAFDADETRPAREYRAAADAAAASGDFTLAIQERFRAAVATLAERSLFSPGRSDTADEVARAIAAQLPGLAAHARPAAAAFDEVTFGDVDGTEESYRIAREFDEAALATPRVQPQAEALTADRA